MKRTLLKMALSLILITTTATVSGMKLKLGPSMVNGHLLSLCYKSEDADAEGKDITIVLEKMNGGVRVKSLDLLEFKEYKRLTIKNRADGDSFFPDYVWEIKDYKLEEGVYKVYVEDFDTDIGLVTTVIATDDDEKRLDIASGLFATVAYAMYAQLKEIANSEYVDSSLMCETRKRYADVCRPYLYDHIIFAFSLGNPALLGNVPKSLCTFAHSLGKSYTHVTDRLVCGAFVARGKVGLLADVTLNKNNIVGRALTAPIDAIAAHEYNEKFKTLMPINPAMDIVQVGRALTAPIDAIAAHEYNEKFKTLMPINPAMDLVQQAVDNTNVNKHLNNILVDETVKTGRLPAGLNLIDIDGVLLDSRVNSLASSIVAEAKKSNPKSNLPVWGSKKLPNLNFVGFKKIMNSPDIPEASKRALAMEVFNTNVRRSTPTDHKGSLGGLVWQTRGVTPKDLSGLDIHTFQRLRRQQKSSGWFGRLLNGNFRGMAPGISGPEPAKNRPAIDYVPWDDLKVTKYDPATNKVTVEYDTSKIKQRDPKLYAMMQSSNFDLDGAIKKGWSVQKISSEFAKHVRNNPKVQGKARRMATGAARFTGRSGSVGVLLVAGTLLNNLIADYTHRKILGTGWTDDDYDTDERSMQEQRRRDAIGGTIVDVEQEFAVDFIAIALEQLYKTVDLKAEDRKVIFKALQLTRSLFKD